MTDTDDLKELFRAEMGILRTEVQGLREDVREVKEAVNQSQVVCHSNHGDVTQRIISLENDRSALARERKLVLGGLAIALTGAVKGLFDWIVK